MVNPISVSITAVDNVTKVIQRVNANMERMQAPIKNVQRTFERFSQLSGMNRLNEGFSRIRASATSTFRVMGQIAPVLGTITSAVTIAGMTRLATSWANFGSNIQSTSQRLGISVSGLHSWQNGARLAGVSAQSMTNGIKNLQDGMWDAVGGRNPQMVAAFQTLHVSFRNADGSARKASEVMPELADKIAALKNPVAQAKVAMQFFGAEGEALLPFFRKGSAGMAQYRQESIKLGVMNEAGARAADQLRRAQARLTQSVEGFGNSLAQSIEPVLSPIINNMANWIAVNRVWITQNIARYVRQFANYLKSINWQRVSDGAQQVWNSIKQFGQTIQENIDKIGGFKTVLEIVAGLMAFKVVSSVLGTIAPFASMAMTIGRVVVPALVSLLATMGPVGWGIMAAGIIIGGAAVIIYKYWDTFRPYWEKLWSWIKTYTKFVVDYILPTVSPFVRLAKGIIDNWKPIKEFFKNMWDSVKDYFYSAWSYIGNIINKIIYAVGKVGKALGITKAAAQEVSNVMQVDPPSLPVKDTVAANGSGGANVQDWVGNWFGWGGSESEKNPTNQGVQKVMDKIGGFFSSVTNKVDQATKAPPVAAQPSHAIVPATSSSLLSTNTPVEQMAKAGQRAATSPLRMNATLNGYVDKATQGSMATPAMMKALIMTESSGRMVGNSKTSAYGYTQLTNAAAAEVGVNKYDPFQNVLGGRKYYEKMLKKVHGNVLAAYGAYHDGGNSKGVKQFLKSGGKDFSLFSPDAQKAMMNFQKYFAQAQGGKLSFNQAVPQGIVAANNNKIQAAMPNMSNIKTIAPITPASGLGQLGGAEGMNIPSAPPVNLPMFDNNSNQGGQKLVLEIDIKGKPQGMEIKPKSRSPQLKIESVSYQRAMDPVQSAGGL
ncbi:transglycosylase SLT domain-containing protein [Commensalibacter oyaizuii]|uniref:Transglycosylase SLT domain-containing protein n=1 Tax=Commensalibacter oyaizuii TaxID=3043873 RepID=A0ABT6Q3C1_9PROT|nr:transglycosylase SLT domain-containing protein [Commensalibacter sp. TBRC 16381]MDI2091625.1 transglycosylase SLT domain-containing protein [Commensalibacter sp. TBRC 16381]